MNIGFGRIIARSSLAKKFEDVDRVQLSRPTRNIVPAGRVGCPVTLSEKSLKGLACNNASPVSKPNICFEKRETWKSTAKMIVTETLDAIPVDESVRQIKREEKVSSPFPIQVQ